MALNQKDEPAVEAPPVQVARAATCLNCGQEVDTAFCPYCGQENQGANLTLRGVLREIFSEVAYYDSKIWRTIAALVFHPGKLSIQWAIGKRTRYISPVRLYLAVTFLFFVAASWRGSSGAIKFQSNSDSQARSQLIKQIADPATAPRERDMLIKVVKTVKLSPSDQRSLDEAISQGTMGQAALVKSNLSKKSNWLTKQQDKVSAAVTSDANGFEKRYIDQIPKVLFVVLPLLAFALKCLYFRQKRFYVEHLVFLLHLHSFAFLALLVPELFPSSWESVSIVKDVIILAFPIYGFVAMLRFYKQRWWVTAFKAFVLTNVYLVLLAVGAVLALLFLVLQMDDVPPAPSNLKPAVQAPVAQKGPRVSVEPRLSKD